MEKQNYIVRYYFASDTDPDTVYIIKRNVTAKSVEDALEQGDPITIQELPEYADYDFGELLNWTAKLR